jgi:Zn/Cd-binding protein ZinT
MNITNYLEEHYPHDLDKILLADGFEEAFMGVVESFGTAPKACYNYDGCINILTADGGFPSQTGMTYDEAVEYLEFNVTQAYVGEHTPAFIRLDLGEQKL